MKAAVQLSALESTRLRNWGRWRRGADSDAETAAAVDQAVMSLTPMQKTVMELWYVGSVHKGVTASRLGIGMREVDAHFQSAVLILRRSDLFRRIS